MANAAEQLRLDVIVDPPEIEDHEIDIVDSVLAACHGDHRLAIRELLADADFLRDQLFIAANLMSHGMGRGWRPKY